MDVRDTFTESAEFSSAATGRLTARTGQTCPESGIWRAQGHRVPQVLVRQGERMPEFFAPSSRGGFRPQSVFWELERKV
ncbi:hypothetical protein BZM27_50720 [Paraburkholderia steynii]|uniref:Uncharacterized protein n=1 Tax=Paraburkholderia steynii TaxID=1245441 RepID=A0A4R0X381_9BURK|nr:hypothetical protein BZM27_50720 [Paraburkholderia steynii]